MANYDKNDFDKQTIDIKDYLSRGSVTSDGILNSWSKTFMVKLSRQWKAHMNNFIEANEDTISANKAFLDEALEKVKFVENKITEEKLTLDELKLELKIAKKEYDDAAIPPLLVKHNAEFFELTDDVDKKTEELKKETDELKKKKTEKELATMIKRLVVLEKKHEEYEKAVNKRLETQKKYNEAEEKRTNYEKYLTKTKFTQTLLNRYKVEATKLEKVLEVNQKAVFTDAIKLRDDFYKKLNSIGASNQLSAYVKKLFITATNGQLYTGEFTETDVELLLYYFSEFSERFMEEYIRNFNFLTKAILPYGFDASNQEKIEIDVDKIDFKVFLGNILRNMSRYLMGCVQKSFQKFKLQRDNTSSLSTPMSSGDSDDKETTLMDKLNGELVTPSSGNAITNYNTSDSLSKKLFKQVKKHFLANKDDMVDTILELLRTKLPERSLFQSEKPSVRNQLEKSFIKIIDDIEEGLMRESYVSAKIKNIIVDAFGGIESSSFIPVVVNIVKNVIENEMARYFLTQKQKDEELNVFVKNESMIRYLEDIIKKTRRELMSMPKIASKKVNAENGFEKPSELAQKLVVKDKEARYTTENKVDFLLSGKRDVSKDNAKSNTNIQTTPLRTQHDYGYAEED